MTPFGSPLDDRANPIYSEGTDTRVSPSCALLVALSSPAACCCVEIVIPYVYFSVGLGMAVSPIAGRMCKISVEDVLDPPATAPAAGPTIEEPAPKRGDPVQAPGVERPAAVDSGPTAAEVAADLPTPSQKFSNTRGDGTLSIRLKRVRTLLPKEGHPHCPQVGIIDPWTYVEGDYGRVVEVGRLRCRASRRRDVPTDHCRHSAARRGITTLGSTSGLGRSFRRQLGRPNGKSPRRTAAAVH